MPKQIRRKPDKIYLAIFVVVALLVGGILIWWSQKQVNEIPKEIEIKTEVEKPISEKVNEEIDTSNWKTYVNEEERFLIDYPEDYKIFSTGLAAEEKLRLVKLGKTQKEDTELYDGLILVVSVQQNPNNLSLEQWAKQNWEIPESEWKFTQVDNISAIETVEKATYGEEDSKPLFLENSEVIDFTFIVDNKVYTVSCTTIGPEYKQYAEFCRKNLIRRFKML